jgi:hypothetical protein
MYKSLRSHSMLSDAGAAAYPNVAPLVCVCGGAALPFGNSTTKLGSFIRGRPFRTVQSISIVAGIVLPPMILYIKL